MLNAFIGALIVVILVGLNIISTDSIQHAGSAMVNFAQNDVKPLINKAATTIEEATK
jgi:hypothetical protein